MPLLINFLLFQIAWFACVLGAGNGLPWVGPAVVALVLAYHLFQSDRWRAELHLIVAAAVLGTVFDTLLVASDWVRYPSGQWHPLLAPYWIVTLWIGFATTLNLSLAWLKGRPRLAALFGAIGGPLAYLAGAELEAITLADRVPALAALALGWALMMPLLTYLAGRWAGPRRDAGDGRLASAVE